jgi:NADH-quinone oxidoreductase subunit N
MAGVPPLAGFFSKFYILLNLIDLSLYGITLTILFFSTISSYYYLSFIKYILFEKRFLLALYFCDIKPYQLVY